MSYEATAFYRRNTQVCVDFAAGEIRSDGAEVLLVKPERQHKLIQYFSEHMTDRRHPIRIPHSMDVTQLKNDPLFEDILDGEMASQSTFEV